MYEIRSNYESDMGYIIMTRLQLIHLFNEQVFILKTRNQTNIVLCVSIFENFV